MRKYVGIMLMITLIFAVIGSGIAIADPVSDDFFYQMAYDIADQAAREAGYKNYEIIVDDNYNVTINVLDDPTATEAPSEEKQEDEQAAIPDEKETEPEEKLSSEEEYALGIQELEQKDIVKAMQHFLRALPNEDAERLIAENAYDYVDELMFAEDYQSAQTFMLDHPFDGCDKLLAECNDHCFLLDLAKALNSRWEMSDVDTSTYSDQKIRELYQQCVECEIQYLDKYMSLGFSDTQIANYAYAYIGALQSQMTGAAYYGIDNEKFNENWIDHGRYVRSRLIYLINKKYEIKTDSSHDRTLKEVVTEGKNLDYIYAVSEWLTTQLSSIEFSFSHSSGKYVYLDKFDLKNTSGYDIRWLDIDLILTDNIGHAIGTCAQLFEPSNIRDGAALVWHHGQEGAMIFEEQFDSMYFECEMDDPNGSHRNFLVYPSKQYSWDGQKMIIGGKESRTADEVVNIEELKSNWLIHNDLFVPCVEFIFRNDGEGEIKEANIECVFIDKEKNTEWSREKYYAISSSDTPLQSGQGRNVIVYSGNGYERKTRKVPDLAVEIYVNGEPITKTDVNKP